MKKIISALCASLLIVSSLSAQTRTVGVRRLQIDDNAGNNSWLISSLGSVGLDGVGTVTGTFPKTNAMLTLAPGAKTFGLVVDGGSLWGIDITTATANSLRTAGRSIFGDGVGVDNAIFNVGTGGLTVNGPTNSAFVVNGVADAIVGNVAADPVWDSRIVGDQLVTGRQKIGGSIWLDGTSATHQIIADAPLNIGTTGNNPLSLITGANGNINLSPGGTGIVNVTGPIMFPPLPSLSNLDMGSFLVLNIGNPGTDFTPGGGLTLADKLTIGNIPTLSTSLNVLVTNAGVVEQRTAASIIAATAWALGGNTLPISNIFGTLSATDVLMQAGGATQMTLRNTGGVNIPTTTAAGVGVIFQNGTRFIHSFGTNNFFAGNGAGNFTMTGGNNTATGQSALTSNTTGFQNTATGQSALTSNTTGSNNTANGFNALLSNTTGFENTANGANALRNNTTGIQNTANGFQALFSNTTGSFNTANGVSALFNNTTGNSNTANGRSALSSNTTGFDNTASGVGALQFNTTGSQNTANGNSSLFSNTTGSQNTATGVNALANNTSGGSNTANGVAALVNNTTASNNVAIGVNALLTQSFSNGGVAWNSNNTAVGAEALFANQPTTINNGINNSAVGFHALRANTIGNYNTAMGYTALENSIAQNYNTAYGAGTLRTNTTGYLNTAVGGNALYSNIGGSQNIAMGISTLYLNQTGNDNVAIGVYSMYNNINGNRNVAVGNQALGTNSSGSNNTAIGNDAMLSNQTGDNNTATGLNALRSLSSGSLNSAFGKDALYTTSTGGNNTGVGYSSGVTNTSGSNNTYVGYLADASAGNLSNSSAVGNGAIVTASNNMRFGNGNVVGWGFGTNPVAGVDAIRVGSGATNGNGATLSVGGAWTNGSSRNFKERFTSLNGADVLSKISGLNVLGWYYKGTEEYHIGPIAEDFYATFNTGNRSNPSQTERYISSVDPAGVALIGVQELTKKNEEQAAQIKSLQERLERLEKLLVK